MKFGDRSHAFSGRMSRGIRGWCGRRLRPVAEVLELRQLLATITVDTTGDGDGADGSATLSLRQAIEVSNGTLPVASLTASQAAQVSGPLASPNTIDFAIPGTGPFTINPATPLPTITAAVTIDGYSQTGAQPNTNGPGLADNAILMIGLDGSDFPMGAVLTLNAPGITVQGLAIGGPTVNLVDPFFINNTAITMSGAGSDLIQGDFLGTDTTGTKVMNSKASSNGIDVNGQSDTIGGTTPAARNVISGNTYSGIKITGSNNLVEGNEIGTDATVSQALPNGYGITIYGEFNTIGGTAASARNVISGNSDEGIIIGFGTVGGTTSFPSSSNLVAGNYIGTEATGTTNLANNGDGIAIYGDPGVTGQSNTIGGTAAGAGNVISGNSGNGLFVVGSTSELVEGNKIGTNAAGNGAVPNGASGLVLGGTSNTIGGTAAGAGNVISGDLGDGVEIGENGGFTFMGFFIPPDPTNDNTFEGNDIGTDATATKAIPNRSDGIVSFGGVSTTIGGTAAGAGNVISGNLGDGVDLEYNEGYGGEHDMILSPFLTTNTTFEGNAVGTDATGTIALPNGGDGISSDGQSDSIGGTAIGAANLIAFNGKSGVSIVANNFSFVEFELISGNSIFANGGLGIDLGEDGVTPNNPAGSPTGPNRLQPYPVLTSATSTATATTISSTLDALPSTSYTVEFFANPAADPSGFGQGKTYLGSTIVTTDDSGHASFGFATTADLLGQFLSATATDPLDNTSEFSGDLAVGSSPTNPTPPTTVTLVGPNRIATLGQPIAFTADVPPTAAGAATGSVAFLEDGVVIGSAPLGAAGVAVFATGQLLPGPHSITADYLGDPTHPAGLSNPVAVGVFAPLAFGGPSVTSDVFIGPRSVKVTFDRGLFLGPAQDAANYTIVGPGRRKITIQSAVYNPGDASVTLSTGQLLDPHKSYQLTINGTKGDRIVDVFGIALDGGGTKGKPGHNYVGKIAMIKGPAMKHSRPTGPKTKAHK